MAKPRSSTDRCSVLIFCVDEMRADHMGCAGDGVVQTPSLDALAADGTLFTRSYCNNPICMPARATMLTGLLPRDHGLRVNGQSMHPGLPTLPGVLAEAGYRTHAAGKLHVSPWVPMVVPPEPERFPECLDYWNKGVLTEFPVPYYGFQSVDYVGGHTSYATGGYLGWLRARGGDPALLRKPLAPPSGAPQTYKMAMPEELHYNRFIADSTMACIRDCARGDKPFFIWCSFPDPHMPIAPPAPYCDMYRPEDVPPPRRREGEFAEMPPLYREILDGELLQDGHGVMPRVTGAQWREMVALTYGMVTHVDAEVGRVLRCLREEGPAERTLVIFLSDHGDMLGAHGLIWKGPFTYAECVRVPTIVRAPGVRAPRTCDELIAQVDLMPSVLDWCGVPVPGSEWTQRETPFRWQQRQRLALQPGASWLPLLRGEESSGRTCVVIENDNPPTGYHLRCLVTRRHRLTVYPGTPHGELFDLEEDPLEQHNLWYRPEAEGIRDALIRQLLEAYSMQTPHFPVPPWNS